MYSFGRDFDEGMEIDNIFREYIEKRNRGDFMDKAASALSESSVDIQKRIFEAIGVKIMPFVQAAVNAIESAGFLNIENASNEELICAASRDACDAVLGFYSEFDEYRELVRALGARRFLLERICSEMITVEFLYRINCI